MVKLSKITIVLSILIFTLTSLTSKQNELETDFQTKVDNFLQKYSTDFVVVSQTFIYNGNDPILDKTETIWHKSITLKSKKSFKNKYDQTVFQRLFLGFYQYETEEQCSSALDSLLNCFGTGCGKIKWGDTIEAFKITPTVYLINDKTIITCKIFCEQENNFWTTFKHDLITTFANETSRIIDAGCGGQISFRKF